MSDAKNLLDYIESKYAAVRWATGNAGSRFIGVVATLWNGIAQGATQTLSNRLPGYVDCAPDAINQIGQDRDLFRFSDETDQVWATRVHDAWKQYEQAGTPQAVLADVGAWGRSEYPSYWVITPPTPTIQEGSWARFTLTLPFGSTPWAVALPYGSGVATYGSGEVYGISDATPVAIDHLRKLVRKWKPARSKAKILAVLTSTAVFYDEPLVAYDDGTSRYASPGDAVTIPV